MSSHLFWDNSNIWGGALATKSKKEASVPGIALRIHLGNLYRHVSKDKTMVTKIMGGSIPPECEELWGHAKRLGINVDLLKRVESIEDGTEREQAVDEILHLKMANAILDYDPPQNLILLTGDGAKSDYNTSFSEQVTRALKRGWTVDIFSWQASLSKKKYLPIAAKYQDTFKIHILDSNYYHFTYVSEGEYYRKNSTGEKVFLKINGRRAHRDLV